MNKAAIEKFAVWARTKLISEITYKMGLLGITEKGIAESLPQSTNDLQLFDIGTKNYAEVTGIAIKQRSALVDEIKQREKTSNYNTALTSVIEEVAYTWFNRLVAVRFMEVNDYLPSGVRVLSSENSAKSEPDLVTNPFDTDLEFTPFEQDRIIQLKDENKLDELFRMLFIKQCNKLHDILPDLFEKTDDYSELLLTISFTDKDGVVYHLTHDLNDQYFDIEKEGQVEIIGWMYQYYISQKHEEIINIISKKSISKEEIPAATQLFTTDWVVRYMVDNSLGRYWIERNPYSKLADKLQFFVTPHDGNIVFVDEKVSPEELTLFDPCMGSGHILVYAFDVLMEIYRECGYSDRDAAVSIIENNLFGLDIDKRAYQLAYFAVMMKARSYNRRILTSGVKCNLAAIDESNGIDRFSYENLTYDREQNKIGEYLINAFRHAREIGSLQTVEKHDYKAFAAYIENIGNRGEQIDIFSSAWLQTVKPMMEKLCKQAEILSKKYAVVCTNPPYLGKLDSHLKDFVGTYYKAYSGDLFSVFMYRNFGFCKQNGYSAFMTPFVWMFIKTYEALRNYIIETKSITSLVQMEYSAFEEATVPICSFILKNGKATMPGVYFRLSDFKGGMDVQKQKVLEAISDRSSSYIYNAYEANFAKVPTSPIAYWLSDKFIATFENKTIGDVAKPRQGLATGCNDLFIRQWYEVSNNKICYNAHSIAEAEETGKKWFPYNKGGEFRKWYGNNDYVVNWENNGFLIRNFKNAEGKLRSRPQNTQFYFKESISWSLISSGTVAFRYKPYGHIFDIAGMSCFADKHLMYLLALCNSPVALEALAVLAPTINFQAGDIANIPVVFDSTRINSVEEIVNDNVSISKKDWDSFEISWDFRKHPLVPTAREWKEQLDSQFATTRSEGFSRLAWHYKKWEQDCYYRFNQLKANEEELNRIFIEIYGLQDELTPDVAEKDVTVHKADLSSGIRSLISYAVGCMLGRYSLDVDGIAYAGGTWDNSKYSSLIPDADNCIPITDEEYFKDDIVGRFVEFIKVVYGEDTLEENLSFIANALGNKGNTSREIIRNYFLNDFMADHIKTYQKRPIYWMFDSGKQNGFKALVYMHRWNADTIGNMRVEYLHRMQRVYESEINRMQEIIDNSANSREVSAAEKRKDKLTKQLKETKDYDAKVAHLALSRIDIDLDDGVKVNYEKVQTPPDGKNMGILTKIK